MSSLCNTHSDKTCILFSCKNVDFLAKKLCNSSQIIPGKLNICHFSDGEINVEILDNVKGKDVFVLQSISNPVNDSLMELILLVDALKRASVANITAVIPYYGYARQDRIVGGQSPISAKIVANLLIRAGVSAFITIDIHSVQIQGFVDVPFSILSAEDVMFNYLSSKLNFENVVVVSPDVGGVSRARSLAEKFGCDVAIIDKRRYVPNEAVAIEMVGNVADKVAIIYDDLVDTAGTLVESTKLLLRKKVKDIIVCCTHPVLSGDAVNRIKSSCIKEMIVTDTIPFSDRIDIIDKVKVLSIASVLQKAML